MNTLVVYYSYSGHTKAQAEKIAKEENAALCEIRDIKRPSVLGTYFRGCPASMAMKRWPIQPPDADLSAYDTIVLMAPVWAGHPSPQFNAAVDLLPRGKKVRVVLVSGGGGSRAKEKIAARIAGKGCEMIGYENIKEATPS